MNDLYRDVINLRHKLNNVIDDHSHPSSQALKREVQRLEDEMQVKKPLKSLESRVKQVIDCLKQAERACVISQADINYLHRQLEVILQSLRSGQISWHSA